MLGDYNGGDDVNCKRAGMDRMLARIREQSFKRTTEELFTELGEQMSTAKKLLQSYQKEFPGYLFQYWFL